MKVHSGGAEVFHTDGQTDMTKLIVAFRNFAIASQNFLYVTKGKYVPTEIQGDE
jgi:hypothetical protein